MVDCWTCGAERGRETFCPTCKKVQPVVPGTDHFELLGLPKKMRLARSELEQAFRDKSRIVHPDRFGDEGPLVRKVALEQTTALNEAYRTLRAPGDRARYLLSLEGVTIGKEEERAHDPDFLMEMLEKREALDGSHSAREVELLRRNIDAKFKGALSKLEGYFDDGQGTREEAAEVASELRFLERFLDEVDTKLEELMDETSIH